MKTTTPKCKKCGGTIGPLQQKIHNNIIGIWFRCLYCESLGDNPDTLIEVIKDLNTEV